MATGINSFSACSVKNPAIETKIDRYLQNVDQSSRALFSVKTDPQVRFAFIGIEGKLRTFHLPIYVQEIPEGKDPVTVIVAVLGDDFMNGNWIKLLATVLDDVALDAASADNAKKMNITPLTFNLLDLKTDDDSKVTQEMLHWPSMVHPECVVPMLCPKILPLPPASKAHYGHLASNDFPADSATTYTTNAYKHWFSVVCYAHQCGRSFSLHDSAHPTFGESNWTTGSDGFDAFNQGGQDLFKNIYTKYTVLDPAEAIVTETRKLMIPGQNIMLMEEVNSLAPASTTTPALSTPVTSSPGLDMKTFAQEMSTGIVNVINKSKESTAESEQKETIHDSIGRWSLWMGHKGLDKNNNDILIPAELTDEILKIINIKGDAYAKKELKKGWAKTITDQKDKKTEIGHGVDFEMNTITTPFVKNIQECEFQEKNLCDCTKTIDHTISALSFLRVSHKNGWLKTMVQSQTRKDMDDKYNEKDGWMTVLNYSNVWMIKLILCTT